MAYRRKNPSGLTTTLIAAGAAIAGWAIGYVVCSRVMAKSAPSIGP